MGASAIKQGQGNVIGMGGCESLWCMQEKGVLQGLRGYHFVPRVSFVELLCKLLGRHLRADVIKVQVALRPRPPGHRNLHP